MDGMVPRCDNILFHSTLAIFNLCAGVIWDADISGGWNCCVLALDGSDACSGALILLVSRVLEYMPLAFAANAVKRCNNEVCLWSVSVTLSTEGLSLAVSDAV